MTEVEVLIGEERFTGRLEQDRSPRACGLFKTRLPYAAQLIHARWSGEACWIPTGGPVSHAGQDETTETPQPGQLLYYGGGRSEPEILVPYGATRFACVAGALAGSPLLTITEGLDRLQLVGQRILYGGVQPIRFKLLAI